MNKYLVLCFALPAAGMLAALAFNQIFPFGDRSVLSIDLYHMYATLIAHLHDIIYSGAGGAWSWDIGMGINYFTLFFTNVGSPLNAAIALFPKAVLTDLIALGMVVKAGLCGLCTGWFLRYKWKRCDLWVVAFAVMYALCGYSVNYYWNIMWMDVLFLLPLCLMGIEDMIERGRFATYTWALVASMVCNYYIAALMCGFLVIYFVVTVVSRFSLVNQKRWILKRSAQFAAFSLLAAAIAAVVLVPVWQALQSTSVVMDAFPSRWDTYSPFIDVIKNHLPGAEPNMRSGGLPHIYAGLLAVWLLPLYLTYRRIPLKERLLSFCVLAFMIFCLNYNVPNFIWHGLHVPNDLPFRYSFCYSMMLVTIACPAARRIGKRGAAACAAWGIWILASLYITEFYYKDSYNMTMLIATPTLIAAFAAAYMLRAKRRISRKAAQIAVLAIVCAEMTFGAVLGVSGTGNMNRSAYITPTLQYGAAARAVEAQDSSFWRMDTVNYMTLNDPALYGFRGISHFSSMLSADLQDLLHKLGYHTYMNGNVRANRVAGLPNTPVIDSMMAVKYRMSPVSDADKRMARSDGVWQLFQTDENIAVYRNESALPVAYMAKEDVIDKWDYSTSNPFDAQQELVRTATGEDYGLFANLEPDSFEGDGLTLTKTSATGFRFADSDTSSAGKGVLTYVITQDMPLYFYAGGDQVVSVWIRTSEAVGEVINFSVDGRYPRVIELGMVYAGETIEIRLTLGRSRSEGTLNACLVGLNMSEFSAAIGELKAGGMRDIKFGNDYIKGTVDAGPGQVLLTSVPYDSGWSLFVDGRETELITAGGGAFLAARLPEGQHSVELRWTLPGFDTGLKISLTGLLLFVLIFVVTALEPPKPSPKRVRALRKSAPEGQADSGGHTDDDAPVFDWQAELEGILGTAADEPEEDEHGH